ncbi:rhomboid family intramembrane serine protease [Candidatus Falkowbacteria bacterium CG10_big_fil_rev_8_21_14_0_10_39_11]|uniref:Rhomboid family intramembrane serine protease n=1 Tax=Candidatus Falkowbacteria bacterium CG10_big_fil_rev_8_21_14_0_10_39_11 TaxID=1974565 RepID=A0A2H0V572_9BACT|nr:MAG: rhomboid family intramembrane serine protease [Candidatus Falkowbacteria bacterium CG10_big_fil_rev_8_21_14_0_10_39_11]
MQLPRISYNAPITITFALLASVMLMVDFIAADAAKNFVTARPGFPSSIFGYHTMVTHILGHVNWQHLVSNFSFILLLGPVLEEKYGSKMLLLMIVSTALLTGLLNAIFFSTGLIGASGIVFLMILLISFVNVKEGEIPLTFILIVALFITKEVVNSTQENNISEFAHILGGACGSVFGFILPKQRQNNNATNTGRNQKLS